MAIDRDTALKALLELVLRALLAMDADGREMAGDVAEIKGSLVRIEARLQSIEEHQRSGLYRSLLRLLDRAAEKNPIQTIAVLGPSTAAFGLFGIGGAYSIIWHESPAMVLKALFTLFPFGGP